MKRRIICGVAGAIVILVVLLGTLPLLARPWVFSIRTAIDVNSGDIMRQTRVFGVRIRENTQATAFSHEVRRVRTDLPAVRDWKRVSAQPLIGRPISYGYSGVPDTCDFLVRLLNVTETPDEDRCRILKEALAALQTGEVRRLKSLVDTVGSKLEVPVTPY
jgi:hypothetical protein